jgi:hypothetical protein
MMNSSQNISLAAVTFSSSKYILSLTDFPKLCVDTAMFYILTESFLTFPTAGHSPWYVPRHRQFLLVKRFFR